MLDYNNIYRSLYCSHNLQIGKSCLLPMLEIITLEQKQCCAHNIPIFPLSNWYNVFMNVDGIDNSCQSTITNFLLYLDNNKITICIWKFVQVAVYSTVQGKLKHQSITPIYIYWMHSGLFLKPLIKVFNNVFAELGMGFGVEYGFSIASSWVEIITLVNCELPLSSRQSK